MKNTEEAEDRSVSAPLAQQSIATGVNLAAKNAKTVSVV
jgi:hypothetical protein